MPTRPDTREHVSTILADGTVLLPEAPDMPGLRFRLYRGPVDHPGMIRVRNAHAVAYGDPETRTVEGMDSDYAHLTNSDPHRDVLIVELDGAAVAYARASWEDQNEGGRAYVVFSFTDPAQAPPGIGRGMLRHSLRRLREVEAEHPTDEERWFLTFGEDDDLDYTVVVISEGFRPIRRFAIMRRPDLDDILLPPLPPGLEVRPVQPADWMAIHLAGAEAFLDGFGGSDGSDEAYHRWVGSPTFDPSLFVVAWEGSEVAAAVICYIEPKENERDGTLNGWLGSVFTRRAWRNRGLAGALVGRSLVLLRDRGMTSGQPGRRHPEPQPGSGFVRDRRLPRHQRLDRLSPRLGLTRPGDRLKDPAASGPC